MIPEISASKVAGLIGLHKFQNADEIAYELLNRDALGKSKIAMIERTESRRPFNQLVNEILREGPIQDIVGSAIRSAQKTKDVQGVLSDVIVQANLVLEMRHAELPSAVRTRLSDEVRGKVSKQRGLNNEDAILNTYEAVRDVKVTERNTKTIKKDFGTFKLVGRCDGYVASENRIVDSKDRTRYWSAVPIYDEIQLRCYMNMYGATEAELIERFPGGDTRHTKYSADHNIWSTLEESMRRAVEKLQVALSDDNELKRIVYANTVSLQVDGGTNPSGGSTSLEI
jgi:hypothetical protein